MAIINRRQTRHGRRLGALLAAVCMCASMAGCGQVQEEETMSELVPVNVQNPETGALTLQNEFVGTVSPQESVYVMPLVTAEVISTNVSVGDVVSAGDELCKLDSEAAQLQLASAQAQYDSAVAGVNSAQLGYDMAQAQYESTEAQLDAQLGGQQNLQLYQMQSQIDSLQEGIDDLYDQQLDLSEQKADLKEQRDEAKSRLAQIERTLNETKGLQAALEMYAESSENDKKTFLETYKDQLTQLGVPVPESLDDSGDDGKKVIRKTYDAAKAVMDVLQQQYAGLQGTVQQLETAIDSVKDGEDQLDGALEDAYTGLDQAQVTMNITRDQIFNDTQKVVDANKKTAELSVESAAASVDSAQLGIAGAQIAVDSAEYQLDMYTLKAPIGGVIESASVKEHDFASPGTPAYIISNKDTMTVTFYVSEGIRSTLTAGQAVSVDRNGRLYDAVITEIGSMIDQNTGLFAVKTCVSTPDDSLLTGCSVKVTVDTYSQNNALLIPYDAVYYDDGEAYVYVAADGVAQRRNIETGIFDEDTITVLSGLTPEDQLITSWSANLREGAQISVVEQSGGGTGDGAEDADASPQDAVTQDGE